MANTPYDRLIAYASMLEVVAVQPKRKVNVKRQQSKTATRVRTRHATHKPIKNKFSFLSPIKHSKLTKNTKPLVKTLLKPQVNNIKPVNNAPTKEQLQKWSMFSYRQQIEYLKDHPKSIFKNAPLNKKDLGNSQRNTKPATQTGNSALIHHRDMTPSERRTALRNIELLSKDRALKPGSKERENCAILLDRNGAASIKETLKPEEMEELLGEFKNIKHKSHIKHRLSTTPKIKPHHKPGADVNNDDDDEDEDEQHSKHHTKLALILGGLVVASLLGIALASVNPAVAMYIGYHVVNHVRDVVSNMINSGLITADTTDDELNEIAQHAADYVRDAKLPKNTLKELKLFVGKK